jgi:hypothetical protein
MRHVRIIGLSAVVVGVMFSGVSAGAAPAPLFSNAPLLRPEGGSEPAISIAGDGKMAITALNPTSSLEFAFTNLWKGSFGSTPAYEGPIDARINGSYGGDDADVDIGSTGTLHVSTLVLVFNPKLNQLQLGISSIACPGGDTSNHYGNCTSQLLDTTKTDRPFITSDGRHVYIIYHDAANSATIRVQRSDDDGVTWKRVGDATAGLGHVTAGATFNNGIGPIVADPRSHTVYAIFSSGTPKSKCCFPIVHNKLYVASSSDLGQHWTANMVYEAAPPTNFSEPFPGGLAIDPVNGSLFAAFSDGQTVYFSRSADGAKTWSSPPAVLNAAPAQTALFAAVAAYGGTVDATYYGTSASSHNDPNAVWNVYLAKSSDGGAHFGQSTVTTTANHEGEICTEGEACTTDRTLLDLFEIAIDPSSRRAAIAYATDTVGPPFQITSGPHKGTYRSWEALFTRSLLTLPSAVMKGGTTYVGLACPGEPVPPAVDDGDPATQEVAVIMRGTCLFDEKAQSVLDAGYGGFVVFNNAAGGDGVFHIRGGSFKDIPGESVGHTTGLAIFNAASDSGLVVGATGAPISVGRLRVQTALAQETP